LDAPHSTSTRSTAAPNQRTRRPARKDPLVLTAERDQQNDPTAGRVLALIAGAPGPLSSAALREKLGVRNQLVADALRALADTGQIRRAGRDGWVQRAS